MVVRQNPEFISNIFDNIIAITNETNSTKLIKRDSQIDVAIKLDNFFSDKVLFEKSMLDDPASIVNTKCLIEAPTGVGKSYAYLIPAILNKSRTAIITANKALQDQLLLEDLPAITDLLSQLNHRGVITDLYTPSYEVLKGNENYLCRLKLNYLMGISTKESCSKSIFEEPSGTSMKMNIGRHLIYVHDPEKKFSSVKYSRNNRNTGETSEQLIDYPNSLLKKIHKWSLDQSIKNPGDFANLLDVGLNYDQRRFLSFSNDDCPRNNCLLRNDCFVYQARHRAAQADILITNNASFLFILNNEKSQIEDSNTPESQAKEGNKQEADRKKYVLCDRQQFIVDEAHNFDDALINFFATDISLELFNSHLQSLLSLAKSDSAKQVNNIIIDQEAANRSLVFYLTELFNFYMTQKKIYDQGYSIDILFHDFLSFYRNLDGQKEPKTSAQYVSDGNKVTGKLAGLDAYLDKSLSNLSKINNYLERKLDILRSEINTLKSNIEEHQNYEAVEESGRELAQIEHTRRQFEELSLMFNGFSEEIKLPFDNLKSKRFRFFSYHAEKKQITFSYHLVKPDQVFADLILDQYKIAGYANSQKNYISKAVPQWAFVSATMTVNNKFDFYKNRLGIVDSLELSVKSPFTYSEHAVMYINTDPNVKELDQEIEAIVRNNGNVLWLCTSKRRVEDLEITLRFRLNAHYVSNKTDPCYASYTQGEEYLVSPWKVYSQEQGYSKNYLIDQLKEHRFSVLIATKSFWEGVNLKGKSLSMVIIDKIPYPQHGTAANTYLSSLMGKSFFPNFYYPKTYSILKQGIGRLIRSESDYGVVIIRVDLKSKRLQQTLSYLSNEYADYYRTDNFDELLSCIDTCQSKLNQ